MTSSHKGSCLCGAVRFTASGPLRGVLYCHCSQCRKQTGHYYAATNVADDDLTSKARKKSPGIGLRRSPSGDFARSAARRCSGNTTTPTTFPSWPARSNSQAASRPRCISSSSTRATTTRSTTACRNSRGRRRTSRSRAIDRRQPAVLRAIDGKISSHFRASCCKASPSADLRGLHGTPDQGLAEFGARLPAPVADRNRLPAGADPAGRRHSGGVVPLDVVARLLRCSSARSCS